jgi:hypothetical protein
MSTVAAHPDLDADQLSAAVKTWDQLTPCPATTHRTYYILAESGTDNASRVVLKDLKTQLPLDDLRRRKPNYQNKQNLYIDVGGDYFPDLIEAERFFCAPKPFWNT